MRIEVAKKRRFGGTVRRLWSIQAGVVLALVVGLLVGTLCIGIIVGVRLQKNGNAAHIRFLTHSGAAMNFIYPLMRSVRESLKGENVLLNVWKGMTAGEVDRLVIDIEHLDYQKLAQTREQALKLGVLFTESSDYVPATITTGNESVRVKLRLKGDLPDHFDTDKWSLRIVVRGEQTLLGMKRFSIQRPETRNYLTEWLFLEALRREGVLALRYRFVDVTINGVHKGIYALEEHFDKLLIEKGGQRQGPILKFDEDLHWREYLAGSSLEEYGSFSSSPIVGYSREVGHGSEYERAVSLLEAFRLGRLQTTEVFDSRKLAMFLAIREVSGAMGTQWMNLRLYYNPVSSKLEPIGFDCEASEHTPIDQLFCYDGGTMIKRDWYAQRSDDPLKLIFRDRDFFPFYVNALGRVSEPDYLDELYASLGDEVEKQWGVLYREYPYLALSDEVFRRNQEVIRSALAPKNAIHAYHDETGDGRVKIKVSNIQSFPVEIVGMKLMDGRVLPPIEPTILGSKRHKRPVEYVTVSFPVQDTLAEPAVGPENLAIQYRLLGSDLVRTRTVYPWSYLLESVAKGDWIKGPSNLDGVPFLSVHRDKKTIVLRPGKHVVGETLVLPAGYTVVARAGVDLDLRQGAKIISHSSLDFRGTEDTPVRIHSSDSSGQGILVLGAKEQSTVRHVEFDNLGALAEHGWKVPGAVTFYESPVDLEDVRFRKCRAEDALNIMRSAFRMVRVTFLDSQSDAFDGDFVKGRISQCAFLRCGNDAIDLSGSVVEVAAVRMDEIGDKALSAGEGSEMTVRDLRIEHAELGITSKDLSSIVGSDIVISDSRVAICVFQKKPEFGPASVDVRGLTQSGVQRAHLVEEGSSLTVNGRRVGFTHESVDELLDGAVYGKRSK